MSETKRLVLNIPESLAAELKEMGTYYATNQTEMVKRALSHYYNKEYRKDRFGYQAGMGNQAKKRTKQELEVRLTTLRNMSDEELTQHIIDIGYVNEFEEIESSAFLSFRVYTRNDGTRSVLHEYRHNPDLSEEPYSTGDAFSLEGLLKDLVKDKLV